MPYATLTSPWSVFLAILLGERRADIGDRREWWAHQDLNLEPTDYESAALTVELWARRTVV